jgi:RimJ/RimL family protein N-acetyltransferase
VRSGCDAGQLINFTAEILENVNTFGVGRNGNGATATEEQSADRRVLSWTVTDPATDRQLIRGNRVTLQPLKDAHRKLLTAWRDRPHIQKTCSQVRLTELLAGKRANQGDRLDLIIHDENDRPIGLVSLFDIDPDLKKAEIAKLLGEDSALGGGYAREASCLALAYAFRVLGLRRVYLRTGGFNLHNIKLNEKIGFRFEGVLRASEILNDEVIDVVLMSMLAREFESQYVLESLPAESIPAPS